MFLNYDTHLLLKYDSICVVLFQEILKVYHASYNRLQLIQSFTDKSRVSPVVVGHPGYYVDSTTVHA